MKNGLIISAAVAALAGCASNSPMTTDKSLSLAKPAAQAETVELQAGQQALPEKQAMAKASEMEPVLVMQDGVNSAQAAYISGKQALGNGKLDDAQANFEKARELDPNMVDAFVGLGAVFSLAGRHDRAVVEFGRAVSLEPANANWHANLGMAYARNGQFEQAQQSLAKAWSLDPKNSRIEAQLTRVTSVAKANGQATPVAAPVAVQAPKVAASPLQKVGERMFTLSLGGSAPAALDPSETNELESNNNAPLVISKAESSNVVTVTESDAAVIAPAMPAIKKARTRVDAPEKLSKAKDTIVKVPAVEKETKPVKVTVAPKTQRIVSAVRQESGASKPATEKLAVAAPVLAAQAVEKAAMPKVVAMAPEVKKPVATPVTKKATVQPVSKPVAKKAAVKKPVVKKPVVSRPVAKKPVKVRSIRGMVIVAANTKLASQVSTHLALKGLRAEKLAKPNTNLVPLTEIHYRTGHEADVAAVSKALPVRAYPIELGGLPAGVNILVVVGSDMKRAQL